jgi:hypothetical protein
MDRGSVVRAGRDSADLGDLARSTSAPSLITYLNFARNSGALLRFFEQNTLISV